MANEKKRILLVDDATDDIRVLVENLKHKYAVVPVTSGAKALEVAATAPMPDVILLDVMMPEMNGYETCRHLKRNPETADIDVIFVSAHDTHEEKQAGYDASADAGAVDYLVKPVQPAELLQKIELVLKNRALRESKNEQSDAAMQTSMNSQTQTQVFSKTKKKLFEFLSDIHNLPKWATSFALEIKQVDDKYKVVTPDGELFFRIDSDEKTGIIDMYCGLTEDKMDYFPSRVLALPDGNSAYHITNFQWPGVSAEMFAAENKTLVEELNNIRQLLDQ